MKHIKTVAMSLLLANSFSGNEVTWKEIEAEIKPHIKEVESDFSALEKEIQKIHEDYRAIQGDTEFNNLEAETTAKGYNRATKSDKRENKKKLIEANKTDKQNNEAYKNEKIQEIKNNIKNIIQKSDELTINDKEVTLKKIDNINIETIKKDLTAIKNIYEKIGKINKLKTFAELQEFTKEFKKTQHLKETYNREYLYNIVFTAIREEIAVPFLNIIKEKDKKTQNIERIALSFYSYEIALLENFSITDDKLHNTLMKNVLNKEKIDEQKKTLEARYKRSLDITVFTALSNKQDKKTLEENAPSILTMLEELKGTEEENKKMTVRRAIEIFNKLEEQIFKINNEKYKEQTYNEKKSSTQRVQGRAELAKAKIAAQGQIKKETAERNSNDEQKKVTKRSVWETTKKVEKTPSIKGTPNALKKAKQQGKATNKGTEPNFNIIDESDTKEKREKEIKAKKQTNNLKNFNESTKQKTSNYETYDNKEESKTNTENELGITKEELTKAKKGKSNEV